MLIVFLTMIGLGIVYTGTRTIRANTIKKNPIIKPIRKRNSFKNIIKEIFPQNQQFIGDVNVEDGYSESFNSKNVLNSYVSHLNKEFDSIAKLSILGESAWYGAEAVNNLLAVDQHVYDALSQLAGHQLNSISDLHSYLDNWKTDWLGNITSKGIDNLQGHISEFSVADHLRHLGHHVDFPSASNNTGFDFYVDGHPFNVKDVADMTSIHDHFSNYHDIGVISNFDIHGLPDGLQHIDPIHGIDQVFSLNHIDNHHHIVDSALNHDAILNHAHHAADAITGHFDAHFPIITLALSSYRETKILLKGDTDIQNSLKNVGLDLAGTGGGALIGGKSGAVVGTFFTPGIGTVIGGIIGAIIGRSATNKIKTEPLHEANNQYKQNIELFKNRLAIIEENSMKQLKAATNDEQKQLDKLNEDTKKELIIYKNTIVNKEYEKYLLSDEEIIELFNKQYQILENEFKITSDSIKGFTFLQRYLWPSKNVYKMLLLKNCIKNELEDLMNSQSMILSSSKSQKEKTDIAMEVLGVFKERENDIKNHIEKLKNQIELNKKLFEEKIENEKIFIADQRIKAYKNIKEKIEGLRKIAEQELSPLTSNIRNSQLRLETEVKKLGLKPTT